MISRQATRARGDTCTAVPIVPSIVVDFICVTPSSDVVSPGKTFCDLRGLRSCGGSCRPPPHRGFLSWNPYLDFLRCTSFHGGNLCAKSQERQYRPENDAPDQGEPSDHQHNHANVKKHQGLQRQVKHRWQYDQQGYCPEEVEHQRQPYAQPRPHDAVWAPCLLCTPTAHQRHRPDDPEYLEHSDRQDHQDYNHGRLLQRLGRRWRLDPHEPGYHAESGHVQAPLPQVVGSVHEHHHAPITLWYQNHRGVEVAWVTVVHHNGHTVHLIIYPAHGIGGSSAPVGSSPVHLGDPLGREYLRTFV